MSEFIGDIVNGTFGGVVSYFQGVIPQQYQVYFTFSIFTIFITLYALFTWNFYRFLAKRDLLELNLSRYNQSEHSFIQKFLEVILYVVEYIIILPIVVFFWFFVMAIILLFLAKDHSIGSIALISACIVGAVRITAYYSEDLSKDLSKMFPFTILAIALVTPGFFDIDGMLGKISQIDTLFFDILIYLIVIIGLEFILRMLQLIAPEKE